MAKDIRSLVVDEGITKQIGNDDTLQVGVGIKPSTGTALSIGAIDTDVTVPGSMTIDGDLDVQGAIGVVSTTTFQQDATFLGNVSFGDPDAPVDDTVSFANATINSNIAFDGVTPTYKISNLADPTAGSQEAATAKYVDEGLADKLDLAGGTMTGAINMGSQKITSLAAGTSANDAVRFGQVDVASTFVAIGNGSGVAGSAHLAFTYDSATPYASLTSDVPLLIIENVGASGGGGGIRINSADQLELNASGGGDSVIVNSAYGTANFRVNDDNVSNPPVLFVSGAAPGKVGVGTASPATALALASGQFSVPDGTLSAPSIAYGSNLDTGFFRSGASGAGIVTNEAISVTFNSSEDAGFRDLSAPAFSVNATQLFVGKNATDIGLVTVGQRTASSGEAASLSTSLIEAHIEDTVLGSGAATSMFTYGNSLSQYASAFIVKKASGNQASPSGVLSGDLLGSFAASGHNGSAFVAAPGSAPAMRAVAAEAFNGSANGALLDFYTVPTGSTTSTARLRVGANGNVGIGNYSAAVTSPANLFSVDDKFGVDANGRIVEYADAAVTKGDLLAGSASSGFVAVGVGTDGQVLQADSTAAGGVSWLTLTPTPPGGAINNVQLNDGAGGFTGTSSLSFASGTGLTIGAITVPDTDGAAGQVLKTDGAGVLSWQDDVSAPAGNDTEVQFNDGGVFGASANLTWNNANGALAIVSDPLSLTGPLSLANGDGVFVETKSDEKRLSVVDPLDAATRVDIYGDVNGIVVSNSGLDSGIKLSLATAPSTSRLLSLSNDGSGNPEIKSIITTDSGATFDPDVLRISSSDVTFSGTVTLPAEFSIGAGNAVSANVTAANLNTLTGGGDTTLHSHGSMVIDNLSVAGGGATPAQYDACYVSANDTIAKGDQTDAAKSVIAGIRSSASAGTIVTNGRITANFVSGLTGSLAGKPCFLAGGANAGKLTTVAPSSGVLAELGVVLSDANYAGAGTCSISLAIKPTIQLV